MHTRRDFIQSTTAAVLTGAWLQPDDASARVKAAQPARPLVVSSANGLKWLPRAMDALTAGKDPLDAVLAVVTQVEDDPNDHSVGLGGLPNEDGVVELDASVMHGPTHKAGAVAALRNIRNPSLVAQLVMKRTDHVLIVGEGALRFAKAHGFKEEDLLTDEARRIWLKWKESHSKDDDWLSDDEIDPKAGARGGEAILHTHGTINCCAVTAGGDLAGVTTTSGLSYKIPGRVGDSPIIGAGLYVDNAVGAAGSTGRGEANLQNCSSFFIVEQMRAGKSPEEACLAALKRIADHTERRLRDKLGRPDFGVSFYALAKDGRFGGAAFRPEARFAVCDAKGPRLEPCASLYDK